MTLENILSKTKNGIAAVLIAGPLAFNLGLGAYRGYCDMPLIPEEEQQASLAFGAVAGGTASMVAGIAVDSIGEQHQSGSDAAALGALVIGIPYMALVQGIGYGLGKLAKMIVQ